MTDMRGGWLLQGTGAAHNTTTLSPRVRICPPPPVARGSQLSLLEGDCVGL